MLTATHTGNLELREAGTTPVLAGRFPYSVPTVLADGRSEVFDKRAFGGSVNDGGDIHLLLHHDMDKPMASRSAGSLKLTDSDEALEFEATMSADIRAVGYVSDFLAVLRSGLVGGVSPGFRVNEGGDYVKRVSSGLMRVVKSANLVEISAVTKPAYPAAQIEARSWQVTAPELKAQIADRWRR